jgi:integrase
MSVYYRKDRKAWFFRQRIGKTRINQRGGILKREAIAAEVEYIQLHQPELMCSEDDFYLFIKNSYLPSKASEITKRSLERIIGILNNHLIPFFNGPMNKITEEKVVEYKNLRLSSVKTLKDKRKLKVNSDTLRKELQVLKAVLRKARTKGKFHSDPSDLVKLPKALPERLRYINPDDFQKMLALIPKDYQPAVIFGLHTGCRRGEILRLKWPDVDLEHGIASVIDKNQESKTCRLNTTVVEMLRGLDRKQDEEKVFWWVDADYLSQLVRKSSRAVGINDFRFHDIRHTTATFLRKSGTELDVIRKILGHKDTRMTQRYTHLSDEEMTKAVGILQGGFGVHEKATE